MSFVGEEDNSSDNDPEVDADGDGDGEADTYGDVDNEEENEENEDPFDDQDQEDSQDPSGGTPNQAQLKQAPTSSSANNTTTTSDQDRQPPRPSTPTVLLTSPSPPRTPSATNSLEILPFRVRPEALTASVYDIVPTIAAPHSTSINSITATPDLRWVFSGGADGYIRKFNWIDTVNGKSMLTVAQRHPFVDTVTKAGVLMSYWENEDSQTKAAVAEEGPYLSSVYSLAVQRDGLWLLSGLENGGINLQSVRHDEGKQIACLRHHTSAISVLDLAPDERSLLSGSWDKSVIDWDLNTGQTKRKFEGSGGQISALEIRPDSKLPVPEVAGDIILPDTFSTNGADKPLANGNLYNGLDDENKIEQTGDNALADAQGSPVDSLFDDDHEGAAPSTGNFMDDDENEFSRAIKDVEAEQDQIDAEGDVEMPDSGTIEALLVNGDSTMAQAPKNAGDSHSTDVVENPPPAVNGLPYEEHEDSVMDVSGNTAVAESSYAETTADTTFLAASMDGSLRIWDKRQPNPIARMPPRNVPPWCMNACWSPDGNFIYAGRRNGTVEEFSLHKGLRGVERSFKLPNGSGPVSAVRAMPNGRHIICASFDILRLDLTVHVTDIHGNDLDEWGVQSLRGSKVSAYIKSTTEMPFRVSVQPKLPYFDEELAPANIPPTQGRPGSDDVVIKIEDSSDELFGQPSSSRSSGSCCNSSSFKHMKGADVSPGRGAFESVWPPFSLVASLYLDGRRKAERKVVVYLDPTDEDFNPPTGLVKFKCRTVLGRDGSLIENAWVFKDIGIETKFERFGLRETAREAVEPEDILVDAMKTSKLGDEHVVESNENEKIGQIVVELERVRLGKKYQEHNYRPKHMEGDAEDVDMGGVGSGMIHTTGLEYLKKQLQKFNFPGYPQDIQQRSPPQRQPLGTILASLTPLSIAHSKYKALVLSKPDELSFETRVTEGLHDPKKAAKPEYEFNDYRDPLKDNSSEIRQHGKDDTHLGPDASNRSSVVVALKEKSRVQPSHPKFNTGPKKAKWSSTGSSSLSRSPPSPPVGSPTQPLPATSQPTASHRVNAETQSPPKPGSNFDIFKTLSSASLALTKARDADPTGPSIGNRDIFRGNQTTSSSDDDNADADDEKDMNEASEQGSLDSVNADEEGGGVPIMEESDKENQRSSAEINNDVGRLHEEFKNVTLGSKRQRGEGTGIA
ncbi:MAG: hypothetical protein Q9169_003344 [Polycauliona sp. 2 TL-2023]